MRQIGFIPIESQARVFRSYLLTLGIHSDVEQSKDRSRWAVWVHEETRLDQARKELADFLKDPKNSRYQKAASEGQNIEKTVQKEKKRYKERYVDLRTHWHKSQMLGGPLTLILIMISIAASVFIYIPGPGAEIVKRWFYIMQPYPVGGGIGFRTAPLYEIMHGQVWRLITPIFLHFGILHILFDMLWLKTLGGMVEGVEGTRRLAVHVLLYAVAGNLLQYYMAGPAFGGMSGVVYGLFAYVWLMGKYNHESRYFIDQTTVTLMLVWFFACLIGIIPNIGNGAHAAGLVLGALWATLRLRRIPFTNVRF